MLREVETYTPVDEMVAQQLMRCWKAVSTPTLHEPSSTGMLRRFLTISWLKKRKNRELYFQILVKKALDEADNGERLVNCRLVEQVREDGLFRTTKRPSRARLG